MNKYLLFFSSALGSIEDITTKLEEIEKKQDIKFYTHRSQTAIKCSFPLISNLDKIQAILVFGGDGTILRAVKHALQLKVPILGINLGHLGFLSEITMGELEKSLNDIKIKKYKILSRMMLKVVLKKSDGRMNTGLALNDAVLSKGDMPKLIDLKVYSDRRYVFSTRCDGIIAASPTGSTAYSLSAGGPIISPSMDAIVVVPITPHVLTVRPIVFPAQSNLVFSLEKDTELSWLQLDGQNFARLGSGDVVTVTSASAKVDFIKLSNRTFYKTLRNKMHLGRK